MANEKPQSPPGKDNKVQTPQSPPEQDNKSQKPPKPPKPYKVYTIRVYVIDGAYNGEMVDEFEFKAANFKGFGGVWVKIAEGEIQDLLETIGRKGHTITTPSGGKLYYPPHRIYYVEAEEKPDED